MKTQTKLLFIIILITLLFIPFSARAADLKEDKVIFGGSFTLKSGESLNGDVVIFGGNATIEENALVNGDIAIFGGRLETNGTINGDVVLLGGFADIGEQTVVRGDLTALGSNVQRSELAVIEGTVVTQTEFPLELSMPGLRELSRGPFPRMNFWLNPFVSLSVFFFRVVVWAGLAILATLFFKEQEGQIIEVAFEEPVVSGIVGLLAAILLPVIVIALLVTILLSPLSILAVLIVIAAWVLGLISLGLEVGKRLTRNLEGNIDPALVAGLGTFLVMIILNGFNKLVPCLGFFPKLFVGIWMSGAVFLTRFGTRHYPQSRGMRQMETNLEQPSQTDDAPQENE